ncbi:MAG: SpoIIE family protein phosphatase [Candidatus Poribacteria bacterium]|nr:SpoIIE family protein phosphatase [Candidatus Poribacteria bacterium]
MRKLFSAQCSVIVFFCFYIATAHAQDSVPTHPVDGTFIKEWLVLGPFFPEDLETDFLASANGEAAANPKPGDTVVTAEGETLTWTVHRSQENIVNLLDAVGNHQEAVCYAFCLLESNMAGDGEILVGSDDGVVVFLNDQRVHTQIVRRPLITDEDRVTVSLRPGKNRCLIKVSNGLQNWALTTRVLPPTRAVMAGIITDESGKTLADAPVHLWQGSTMIAKTATDTEGFYQFSVYPASGPYDLQATHGEKGNWEMGVQLSAGDRAKMNLTLRKAISISGNLLALDNNTPNAGVLVEAILIREDGVSQKRATTLSDSRGRYQFINLIAGSYQLRCHTWDTNNDNLNPIVSFDLQNTLNIDFRFRPFKHGTWKHYTYLDGLGQNRVWTIFQDRDSFLWFGTDGGGISRYDGDKFGNFTTDDGLISNSVWAIHQDREGFLWFGTNGGISRYDGDKFVNFTIDDGLISNSVWAIHQDREGGLWFGTDGGISQYDGENFTTTDGLANNFVSAIHQDREGVLWFGTNGGIFQYDGDKFINLTTDDGLADNFVRAIHQDREGVLWFGTNGGISQYDGDKFINLTTDDGLVQNDVISIYQDREGFLWFGTWSDGISRYDGDKFINFTTNTGLIANYVRAIHQDREGFLWFGSTGQGLSQYDSSGFINFTTADGLVSNTVYTIYRDREGFIWFGTDSGISQYDGDKFINFTTDDGLVQNDVISIYQDREGFHWFGTQDDGVSHYNGNQFVNYTTNEGLANNSVWAIHQDREGLLWFGTNGGISQYDGDKFVNFTTNEGLAQNRVTSIYEDHDGFLWFGTQGGGVSRYDGNQFVNFTVNNGLVANIVWTIYQDRDGFLWFGTLGGGGVSRYDGDKFVNFTTNEGLTQNDVISIYEDRDGFLWFGTDSGGVSRYDGTSWMALDTRDGLINNQVLGICQDSDGKLWFATLEGVSQYNPNRIPPRARIVSVQNDNTSAPVGPLSTIKDITTDTRVTIKYSSIDFKTVKEKRQYRVRIKEIDADWRKPTLSDTFNISFDKPGTYTFEVVAIDRDLNYSAPASLTLTVILPWYQNGWILYPLGGAIVGLILFCGILAYRYYHQRQQVLAYQREAVSELADAQEMQMGLIPQTAPEVPGLEIAGVCSSARTVSGDFFDYVPLSNGTLAVVLADVTGKGMKGAMNAVLSSGALHSEAKLGVSPSQMLQALNNNLYPRFQRYTNCAMAILTIDPTDKTFRYANAGIPYPMVKRGEGDVEELSINGTPLGAFKSSEYEETPPIELKSGNLIILFSDGVTEAFGRDNPDELYMETDRLTRLINGLDKTMNAEAVIDAIIDDVHDFSGDAQQNDDMTIVVIKAL